MNRNEYILTLGGGEFNLRTTCNYMILLLQGLATKARDTGSMPAAYQISHAIVHLTPKSKLKEMIKWIESVNVSDTRMLGDVCLTSDAGIPVDTKLEIYSLDPSWTLGGMVKAYFFLQNKYDPLDPVVGCDEFSESVARYHNFLRANHECLHVLLGLGATEIEEIMLHAIMTELMPAPLSAYLIAYLSTAGYVLNGFTPLGKEAHLVNALRKNGIRSRLTLEALVLAKAIGRQLKLGNSRIMEETLTSDTTLESTVGDVRRQLGVTEEMTNQIASFMLKVAADCG